MADVTKTRADVVEQTLSVLGARGNGAIPAHSSDKIDVVIDAVGGQLSALDIYTFDDLGSLGPTDGAIPAEAFFDFCNCCALAAAPAFGMQQDQRLLALDARSRDNLKIMAAPPRTRKTLRIENALLPRRYGYYYNGQG